VADLGRIGPALGELGYGEEDIAAVLAGNWLRVLRAALPE
ncbi:MAG TPA: peptidase M19, partial [Anaerolineae bacterium]|nr:peptidase M19 [Anaerolineae bacterium]